MRMRNLAVALISVWAGWTIAGDWPEWRGPNRDGRLNAEPASWPEKLNLKWKIDVGEGHSSPILAEGSIYAFARQGDQETVVAVDPANGNIRWRQQYAAPYKMNPAATGHGPGPKSTPLYANGVVYSFGISGILSAFEASTGKLRWRKEFARQYKEGAPTFGTAMSPILDNGLLIAHVGGEKAGALTAFDPATGDVKWSWDGDSPAYASPVVVNLAGARQVITQSRQNIIGVAESTGKLLWKIPFTTSYEQNIVTPVVYRDTLIFSGLDKGVFAVRLAHNGDSPQTQTWSTQKIWENKDVAMYMNSPVISGDLLFGFSHLKKGQLFCLDARTGATQWTGSPRAGDNASLLASASTLIVLTPDGQLLVAKPTAKALGEIRRYEVSQNATWAHPVVLSDGVLVQDAKTLARWGVN